MLSDKDIKCFEKFVKTLTKEQGIMFMTVFDRYLVQLKILDELKGVFEKDGTLVTKEYVKGRENVYTHPAIGEYNKTVTAANNTVSTLVKLIKDFSKPNAGKTEDPLLKILGAKK